MSTPPERRRPRDQLFVVRMWPEPGEAPAVRWRAQVTHVASSERRYFNNYGELCEFIDRCRRET